jgi:hypothetical protein
MRWANKFFIFLIFLFNWGCISSKSMNLKELLPSPETGLKKTDSPKTYSRKNLFDYLNGGAELYLAYDFQKLIVQKYLFSQDAFAQKKTLTVEIFQMSSSFDAYGLFSLDQDGEELNIEQKALYGYGLLKLWKDNYFIRILNTEGTDELKEMTIKMGEEISEKIKNKGELPQLLSFLPENGFVPISYRYFHKANVLNHLYFLGNENILGLSEKTDAVLADFKLDGETLKLLLIEYPDTLHAKEPFSDFNQLYLKTEAVDKRNIVKVEEGKCVGVDLNDKYLCLVFESKKENLVNALLDSLKNRLLKGETR